MATEKKRDPTGLEIVGGRHSHSSVQYLTRQGVVLRQRGERPGCPIRLIRGQKTEFFFLFIEICLLEGVSRVSQVGLEVESGSEWYHIQQSLPVPLLPGGLCLSGF